MASENAVIVVAQADTGHTEMTPVEGADHAAAGQHTAETLGEANFEHAESGMPQLDVGLFPNLIFWLIVSIVALYWILAKVPLPRIGTVLAERNDAIANDIEQAALLKRRAEEAEAAYNAALSRARDEAHKIAAETKAGIDKLDVWLGHGKWDLIHFNFGIHDRATPIDDYRARLSQIVDRLAATGAKLVWASSTPCPDTKDGKYKAAPIPDRNAAAAEVMKKHGIDGGSFR